MAQQPLVIGKRNQLGSVGKWCPHDLADLLLLPNQFFLLGGAQEIHHLFFYPGLRGIFHALPESIHQFDAGQPGFFPHLAQGGLALAFAGLHMAFGEGPVPAKAVAQQYYIQFVHLLAQHQHAAGFFSFHHILFTSLLHPPGR